MNDYIANKVVIITGASSGIGESTAKLLASKGAKLVLGARREGKLKQIVDEIEKDGGQAVYQSLDVTSPSSSGWRRSPTGNIWVDPWRSRKMTRSFTQQM